MTQEEFETRIGGKVTAEEFDTFNEVYMNCEMDKDAFCKAIMLNPKDHDLTRELIFDLSDGVTHYKTSRSEILERDREIGEDLAVLAHAHDDHELRELAKRLLGQRNYIAYCLAKELALESSDREYIIAHMKED